ncbi:MAG: DUF7594 domain-containing protein [Acidimicrobiia bacterium]
MDRRALAPARLRRGALLLVGAVALSPLAAPNPVAAVRATLEPVADASVEASDPGENFGSQPALLVDGSPDKEAYLRFSVPAGTEEITGATLRLWVEDSTSDAPRVRATSTNWTESAITWSNRPGPAGPAAPDVGRVSRGSWVSYDVTDLVTGPGPIAFHLGPDSSDGADFASREADDNRPELVVESGGGDDDGGGGGETRSIGAVIDATAEEASPTDNFGSETKLSVQGGGDPDRVSYLRFDTSDLDGTARRATLRLFVTNDTPGATAIHRTAGNWTEDGLTWQNRPAPTGSPASHPGPVEDGWASFDVTSIVTGAATWNLMMSTGSSDSLAFRSSEASSDEGPQLVVETGPASTTTSSSTTTTMPPTTTTSSSSTTTMPPTTTTSSTTTMPPTSTTTTTLPPGGDDPVAADGEPWLGLARVVTNPCEPECAEHVYSLSFGDVSADDEGDQRSDFRYQPGSAAVLRLEWSRSRAGGGGCGTPTAVGMAVEMRAPGGGRIGGATWQPEIPRTCSGSLERTVHFDDNPMDGDSGDPDYHGVMEVYGRLVGGDQDGADTRGRRPADPGDEAGRYARGHVVSGGFMVGWHQDGDDPTGLAANEATLGEPFGLVRSYEPGWDGPSRKVEEWMSQGKYVLWSVKPPDGPTGTEDWTPVALGQEDAMIRAQVAQLQAWAETHVTAAGYIFHHEPHDNADLPGTVDDCEDPADSAYPCAGTPAEFIDVYERVRDVIDALGADRVQLVYTATMSKATDRADGSDVPGSGDPMTQGAGGESVVDYIDLIGHNTYNWYCFRSSCDWEYPDDSEGWRRGVDLAEAQGKQLIIGEAASHPGCLTNLPSPTFHCEDEDPGDLPSPTRDDYLRNIGAWLESDARARRWLVGFAYYHSLHNNDWRFADQTGMSGSGKEAWRQVFATDSSYNDDLGGHDYFTQYGFDNL